jgi:hypothetical protein
MQGKNGKGDGRDRSSLVGKRFGRLFVKSDGKYERKNGHSFYYYLCECSCGKTKEILGWNLSRGLTKSCGCLEREKKTTHGKSKTGAYASWYAMLTRCTNPKHPHYNHYSRLGVCKRWLSFENFSEDMGERPKGKTLDRIDGEKGYSKKNCRWASQIEQVNNTNSNVILEFNGVKDTMANWSRNVGINYSTIKERLKRGWDVERALTSPLKKRRI